MNTSSTSHSCRENNMQSVLTLHIYDVDAAAVCRHQNLHREVFTVLRADAIGGCAVVITFLSHGATIKV